MEVCHVAGLNGAAQSVGVGSEPHAVLFHYVAGSAHRSGAIIAVLGYGVACSCHHEAGASGDIEGVLAVSSCPHDVDGAVVGEIDGDACFKQCLAEAGKFVYFDAPHLEYGEQGGYLCIVVFALCDAFHQSVCFVVRKLFVGK